MAVPAGAAATSAAPQEVPAAEAEAVVEDLEPISEGSEPVAAPAAADPGSAPIAAAALPRFESPSVETPRHTREVVALDPPEWTGTAPAATDPRPEGERWSSVRLWDAESDAEGEGRGPRPSAAEATGPELPVNTQPARALVGSVPPPPPVPSLDASEEEAERAVAGLTEIDGPVLEEDGNDEPLLAEALGVDLVVDGDEPVPEPVEVTPAAGSSIETSASPGGPVPVSESSVHEISPLEATPTPVPAPEPVSATPPPAQIRQVPRLVPESRPWNAEPGPAPYRRESGDGPRTREAPTLAARSGLPAAPSIPPMRSAVPRLSPVEPSAAGAAPTPLSVVPEPSPTRQERVVAPPPPPEALMTPVATPVAPGRGAGSWSPAELLAQVIAEIQAEEHGAGLPRGAAWEPVPLDATQPISTDEVAARLAAAEAYRPAPVPVAATDDEDLPAWRHEAGRAGMRMALLTAVGLIMGILGGWTAMKLWNKPPRPQAERISEVRPSGQAPAPR
jgi:hypothetical protein